MKIIWCSKKGCIFVLLVGHLSFFLLNHLYSFNYLFNRIHKVCFICLSLETDIQNSNQENLNDSTPQKIEKSDDNDNDTNQDMKTSFPNDNLEDNQSSQISSSLPSESKIIETEAKPERSKNKLMASISITYNQLLAGPFCLWYTKQ